MVLSAQYRTVQSSTLQYSTAPRVQEKVTDEAAEGKGVPYRTDAAATPQMYVTCGTHAGATYPLRDMFAVIFTLVGPTPAAGRVKRRSVVKFML